MGRLGGRSAPSRSDSLWPPSRHSCSPWPPGDSAASPAPYLAGERPLTGLLIGANLGAFVVAFAAGAAGIIALGRAKSGAVVGVLVSITTIPAASNVGVALAMGNPSEAGRSLSILLVNLAGLLVGGVLTLLATRVWARRIESGRARIRPKPEVRP
jgi:4-amino-4-deoxy-L-arabinose transferase-like glycosyltransferase